MKTHLAYISSTSEPVAASCRHQFRSSSACQWWDSRCWSSCWARAAAQRVKKISGLRLPVASSDLRKRTKWVVKSLVPCDVFDVKDDNQWLQTLYKAWLQNQFHIFMRWKGGSWSRVDLKTVSDHDLQLVPAIPFHQQTLCASKRLRDRRQATAQWNWRSNDSWTLGPNRTKKETELQQLSETHKLNSKPVSEKTQKTQKTLNPNNEECIRMPLKSGTFATDFCTLLSHFSGELAAASHWLSFEKSQRLCRTCHGQVIISYPSIISIMAYRDLYKDCISHYKPL